MSGRSAIVPTAMRDAQEKAKCKNFSGEILIFANYLSFSTDCFFLHLEHRQKYPPKLVFSFGIVYGRAHGAHFTLECRVCCLWRCPCKCIAFITCSCCC